MAKKFNPLSKKLGGGFFAFERKNFALKYFWSYEQALKADLSFENDFEGLKTVLRLKNGFGGDFEVQNGKSEISDFSKC